MIPAAALTNFGQMERVYVVAEGRATMRLVKSGARHGDQVEILSGLAAGERVVADGAAVYMATGRTIGSRQVYVAGMWLWGPGFFTSSAFMMARAVQMVLAGLYPGQVQPPATPAM